MAAVSIENKTALVTGASRGIGRSCAIALAQAGANVVIAARNEADLNAVAREITAAGREALVAVADLTDEANVNRLHDAAIQRFGQVDILVNNAGVGKYGAIETMTPQDFDWMMNVNMRATFLVTAAFLPEMKARRSGNLIFVGSVSGMKGTAGQSVYSATKHAQYGFATALDHECREHNVKVSYIAPGGVHTYFALGMGRTAGDPKLQDYLDPEDVAEAVVFAATQPPKGRIFLIGMRAMRETL